MQGFVGIDLDFRGAEYVFERTGKLLEPVY
jgi:hypothetical protein